MPQNEILGSFKNPYEYQYFQHYIQNGLTWPGGWVRNNNGSVVYYLNDEITYYIGRGEKDNPYPQDFYTNMKDNHFQLIKNENLTKIERFRFLNKIYQKYLNLYTEKLISFKK